MTISTPQQQPAAPIMEQAFQALQQSLTQAFQLAINHHQSGQLEDAESLYRTILEAQPNHSDANHNLGVLAVQTGQANEGLPYFGAALEAKPEKEQYWLSYIDALIQADETETAQQLLELGRQNGLQGDGMEALAKRLDAGAAQKAIPSEKPPAKRQRATGSKKR